MLITLGTKASRSHHSFCLIDFCGEIQTLFMICITQDPNPILHCLENWVDKTGPRMTRLLLLSSGYSSNHSFSEFTMVTDEDVLGLIRAVQLLRHVHWIHFLRVSCGNAILVLSLYLEG